MGIVDNPEPVDRLKLLIANMVLCGLVYFVLRGIRLGNRAWYLTVYSSGVASSFGIYFGYQIYLNGLYETMVADTELSVYAGYFFIAYCVMDLVIGFFQYEEQIDYKDGWFHHFFYIALICWLHLAGQSNLFAICLIEEIPTIFLAVSRVAVWEKTPFIFGLSFFILRISLHCYLTYFIAEFSAVMFTISILVLRSHVKWFHRWFQSHLKKKGRMPMVYKIILFIALMVVQTVGHGFAVYRMVRRNYLIAASGAIVAHLGIFFYFAKQMLKIIHNVYYDNFIPQAITKQKVIYNISWEDPRVDHQVLKVGSDDVVLTISSAGCNVLDYMLEGPKEMVAVDFNAAQLCVLELKILCIKYLTYDQFWQIWAKSNYALFLEVYKTTLRAKASERCRSFWDENDDLIRDNFMFAGTSGLMAKILMIPAWFLGISGHMRRNTGKPYTGSCLWNATTRIMSSWLLLTPALALLAPLGGVPEKQLSLVTRTPGSLEIFAAKIRELLTEIIWEKDNYFYYAYIAGCWDKSCCPRYMMEKNFETLRARVDRITLFHGSVKQAVQAMPQKCGQKFTVFSLLDSMDWMPETMIADQIGTILDKKYFDHERGRIFWRSFATGNRAHSPILQQLNPTMLPDTKYPDRVGWYLTQLYVPKLEPGFDSTSLLVKEKPSRVKLSVWGDIKVMWTMAYYGITQAKKDVKVFYKTQADVYDGFREALLPGRDELLLYVVPWTTCPRTWVSVGCGTARDIEYVIQHIKKCKTTVYLCDLSHELLGIARSRVKEIGLTKYVKFIEGDINTREVREKLPEFGTVDLVTCSYCLTMIPQWKKATKTMTAMLRPGGHLAIVDFTVSQMCPRRLDQRFYQFWFANDGVYLNAEQPAYLKNPRNGLEPVWYSEDTARLPYTVFKPTHYQFLGRKAGRVTRSSRRREMKR